MHSSGKTPLIRLAKRDGMAGAGQWGIRIAAILLALVVGGLVILLSGNNPIQGYAIIVEGALGKTSGIRQTVKNFIPLLGTALAIAPCFKMRFWNIGAEDRSPPAPCAPPISPSSGPTPSPRCPCCSSCAPPAPSAAACGRWCPPSSRPAGEPTRLCSP